MRRRFLQWLGMFMFRHAWLMLPLVAALTAASIRLIDTRLKFDTSLIAFLPPRSEHEQKIREIVRDYRNMEPVMGTIRSRAAGQEPLLRDMVRVFAEEWLDDQKYLSHPVYRTDELIGTYYDSLPNSRLIQLLTPDDWDELKRLVKGRITRQLIEKKASRLNAFLPQALGDRPAEDPLGALTPIRERLAHSRGPTRLATRGGFFMSGDGRSIAMLLYPVLATENARDADRTVRFLERSRDALFERYPAWRDQADIEFSGSLVETARNIRELRDDFGTIVLITGPLTVLLLLLVFRKLEAVVFVLLPPFVGMHWTLGLATLLFGGITAVTAAFMAVVGALGLQFSIHLYHRFTLELYRTHHYYRALKQSYVETGRGIFSSAIVLAVIFLSLYVTSMWGEYDLAGLVRVARDSQGLGQLGLVVGLCILCNLAACLATLPLLAAVKYWMARGQVKPVPLYRFHLERIYEPAIQRPQATIVVMLLIAVLCGFYSKQLRFAPRFASVGSFFHRELPAEGRADPDTDFPRPGRPLIAVVEGATGNGASSQAALQAALEQNDLLYSNLRQVSERYGIRAIDSLRTVLPSLKSQQASLAQLTALDLETLRRDLQASSRLVGFRPQVYQPFLKALATFKEAAAQPQYIRFSGAEGMELINTVTRYVTSKVTQEQETAYFVRTAIYPGARGFDPERVGAMRRDLSRGLQGLILIGDPLIEREMAGMIKFNLAVLILLSIATILAALFLHFKQARLAWLTFLPIVAEVLWMCGAMAISGLQIHFFTVLAMPLALSLAMDNALQLTQYFSDRQPCTVRHAMLSVGRVVALNCAVVALLYGTLGLTSYPGFRDFGLTVLIGSLVVLVGTSMLLPAMLQVLGRGQPLSDALTLSGESEI